MLTEDGAKRPVQHVGAGVIATRGVPCRDVDLGSRALSRHHSSRLHATTVSPEPWQCERGVENDQRTRLRSDGAGVPDLTTTLCIERGRVEHDVEEFIVARNFDDLEHRGVAGGAREMQQRDGRDDLEERRSPPLVARRSGSSVHVVDRPAHLVDQLAEPFGRARQTVDRQPLLDPLQVRRGEEADAQARGAADAFEQRARRAFAVRAGDVDEAEFFLRIARECGEAARIFTGARLPAHADAVVMQELCEHHGDAVLIGTASFWEGVDVPGDPLRGLVIQKLPFRVPTEPVTAARLEAIEAQGSDAFQGYLLPLAALRLKQGFGRLIRSRTDRGVVLLLDGRMVSKGYGRYLRDSLPPAPLVKGPWEEVERRVRLFYAGGTPARLPPG